MGEVAFYGCVFGMGELNGRIKHGNDLLTKKEAATIIGKNVAFMVFFPVTFPYTAYEIIKRSNPTN